MATPIGYSAILTAALSVTACYLIAVAMLSNRLKQYPEAWDRAGRFLLVMNNTPPSTWKFLKFLFSDGYKPTLDPTLRLMVFVTRGLFVVSVALIITLFAYPI